MKLFDSAVNFYKVVKNAIGLGGSQLNASAELREGYNKKYEQLPMFDYLFVVKLPDVYSAPDKTTGKADLFDPTIGTIGGKIDPKQINHRVYALDMPFISFETHKVAIKSSYWHSAKHTDIGTLTMRIDEMEDSATLAYLLAWQKRIKNSDGTYNPPAFYKKKIDVMKISSTTKDKISIIRFSGCFPSSISDESMSQDGTGITQYSVTFTCDKVEYDLIDPETTKKISREYDNIIKAATINDSSAFNFSVSSLDKILGRII